MGENNQNQKISFLKRVKIAIFKLEDYGFFLGESFKVSLKYLFILILLLSLVMAILDTYNVNKMISKANHYLESELPEFTYDGENLVFSETVDAYDHEYRFKLLIDTKQNISEEKVKQYKTQINNENNGILALKDKFIYIIDGAEIEYNYKELLEMSGLDISNREDLISFFEKNLIPSINTTFFVMDLIILYISNLLNTISFVILLALVGFISARICGLRFKTLPMFSLAIYSLTLPTVLMAICIIIYSLTGFQIDYVDIMYFLIGCVYIIASIFMIKYDLIKQHFELERILEVQKQVHEELKEKNQEENEKKEDNSEEKKEKEKPKEPEVEEKQNDNREPDGSEI